MFFDDLTESELIKIENLGVYKTYGSGATIIEEGQAGSSFSLILSGRVEVRKNLADGQSRKLVEFGPCDLIGEIGFSGVDCRSASVIAISDSEVMEFNREELETLMISHPIIGLKIYRGMAHELAQRLAAIDRDLMETVVWAIGKTTNPAVTKSLAHRKPRNEDT